MTIELGGETRALMYGFRAFKELGLNPFKPATFLEYFGSEDLSQLDVDKAAAFVRAGTLWEHAKGKPRYGQEPVSVEDVIDEMTLDKFLSAFSLMKESSGKSESTEDKGADPQGA